MARTAKKDVYERINDKKVEIHQAEDVLKRLNDELQELLKEQDQLEMNQMLQSIREQGIDINKALELLALKKNK